MQPRQPQRAWPLLAAAFALLLIVVAAVALFGAGPRVAEPSPSPSATATATPSPSRTAAASPGALAAARPDAQHGVLTRGTAFGILRTEADPTELARFPRYTAAVTSDGVRVAVIRTSETGQQLLIFDTARPALQKTLVDFSGSGEFAGDVVWSSELTNDLLFSVHKLGQGEVAQYSTLRVVEAGTSRVREIARSERGLLFVPLVWHGASSTAIAIETGSGGFAASYVVVRGGQLTRSAFGPNVVASSVRADSDGQRLLAIGGSAPRGVKWWLWDRFDQQPQQELRPAGNDDVSVALWRPGADEIVVYVSPMVKTAQPGARIEVWALDGRRRVLREGAAASLVRVDGSAVISADWMLVDVGNGAATPIPGADRNQLPYLAVKF